jgi:hypothetical protein
MEFLIGLMYLLKAEATPRKELVAVGSCLPDGEGNAEQAALMGATAAFRLPHQHALQFSRQDRYKPWYVTVGTSKDDPKAVADKIVHLNKMMGHNKPQYFVVGNEENRHDSEAFVKDHFDAVMNSLPEDLRPFIVKGSLASAVESHGWKVYTQALKNEEEFAKVFDTNRNKPHFIHAYLAPTWKLGSAPENFKRMVRLAYIVTKLKKMGFKVILGETHDGSYTRKGMPDHGDLIYQSGAGFRQIVTLSTQLGIDLVMHYQASMLGYAGNTTKDWRDEKRKITEF